MLSGMVMALKMEGLLILEMPVTVSNDSGDASFSISGTLQTGQILTINEVTADPDGTGTLSYSWQTSINTTEWEEVGTSSTYAIKDSDQGKKIRAVISYVDNKEITRNR